MRSTIRIFTGLALAAGLSGGALLALPAASACPDARRVGDLGITGLYDAARDWTGNWELFHGEPKVRGVVAGGPADGALQADDVLVAVDGLSITTPEGGHRLANLAPGQAIALSIRRDGEAREVKVTAGSQCDLRPAGPRNPAPRASARAAAAASGAKESAAGAATAASAASAANPHQPAVPETASPDGPRVRFGFRLGGPGSGLRKADAKGGAYWSFPQPPVVEQVEPGSPADLAGLRQGDVLTRIDGVSLTAREGGRHLAAVDAGETVELTYTRGGGERTVRVVTGGSSWPERTGGSQ
jgi:S1-C subfamily serine protease